MVSHLARHIASGERICCAADDAAGLAISEKMRAQIRGMNQARRNAQDGISLLQTAEGNLNETHDILHRIRELVVQAANGTNSDTEREAIQSEINQLKAEIDRIAGSAGFNNIKLLDGSLQEGKEGLNLQIGANAGDTMKIYINNMNCEALGIKDLTVAGSSTTEISGWLDKVDKAIGSVSLQRASLGTYQNALERRIDYLENASLNLQDAESRIRDIDMAKAIMDYVKNNILLQVAQAMLAQSIKMKKEMISMLLESL